MVWASVACSVCVCVCMCSYVSSWQDVGPRSLAVPLAAHGEALLICWSNRCQNTPGAVTLEGQEERRQCVLYTVVHRMSAAWHLLITAATFMWGNQDLPQSWFIRQTRWSRASVFTSVFLGEVASDDIYRLCTHRPDPDVLHWNYSPKNSLRNWCASGLGLLV